MKEFLREKSYAIVRWDSYAKEWFLVNVGSDRRSMENELYTRFCREIDYSYEDGQDPPNRKWALRVMRRAGYKIISLKIQIGRAHV